MSLLRYTLKSIAGARIRFLLTTLAVVVGVAFTVGVFVTTDGLRSTFGDLSEDIFEGVDLSVRSEVEFGDRDFGAPLVDPALVDDIRSVDGVAAAEGGVFEFNVIAIDSNGEALESIGPPQMGVSWPEDQQLSQVSVWPDGISRPPRGGGEFARRENILETRCEEANPTGGFAIGGPGLAEQPQALVAQWRGDCARWRFGRAQQVPAKIADVEREQQHDEVAHHRIELFTAGPGRRARAQAHAADFRPSTRAAARARRRRSGSAGVFSLRPVANPPWRRAPRRRA